MTEQQNLLIEQKYISLKMVDRASDILDQKALFFLVVSFSLAGLTVWPSEFSHGGVWPCLAYAVTTIFLIKVVFPSTSFMPGLLDWNELHTQYLMVDEEESFNQVLGDCTATIEYIKVVNSKKATALTMAVGFFAVQIVMLAVIVWI